MEIIEARNMLAAQVRDKALPVPELTYRPSFSAGETVGPLSFDLAWPEHKVGVIIRDAREHRDERAARYVVETHGWRRWLPLWLPRQTRCRKWQVAGLDLKKRLQPDRQFGSLPRRSGAKLV